MRTTKIRLCSKSGQADRFLQLTLGSFSWTRVEAMTPGRGRWSRFVAALTLTGLAGFLGACGGGSENESQPGAWTGSVDTAASGRVSVENTGGGAWSEDTVRARRTLLIGETGVSAGSEATTFGDIIGLAVDDAGRVYVGDRHSNTVRAYGSDGEPLGLIGGEGQGPGEFRVPDGLAVGPRGRLYVAEVDGLTVMDSRPAEPLPTTQVDQWRPVTYLQVFRPLRVTCDGTVYYPHQEGDPEVYLYLRYEPDGTVRDTVRVPSLEGLPGGTPYVRTGPGGGPMVFGVDHVPLAPIPSWDVTAGGRLMIGESRRYRLLVLSPTGDTLRVVRRRIARRPIPETVRRESTEALRTRLDTLPVPVNEIQNLPQAVAEAELPMRYPAFLQVHAGLGGRAWVERPPLPGRPEATPYDVFDRTGVYLGTVVVPGRFDPGRGLTSGRMRPRPVFTDSAVYGVVVDSVTGVQKVARFSYQLPDPEEGAPSPPARPCDGSSVPSG